MIMLITGATGALGNALALASARPGIVLILQGRKESELAQLAAACTAKGATVSLAAFDLCDVALRTQWLKNLLQVSPPDIFFANAGMNAHAAEDELLESWEATDQLLALNVHATFHLVHDIALQMQKQGRGQLVLISSLAGWYGLPVTPAYSASKSALKTYGEALRSVLAPHGVKLTVVLPGYFHSPMCSNMPGPKPWVWSAERAAGFILKRLRHNPARISFPFPLNFGTWWLSVLPAAWSERLVRWMGYRR